MIERGRAVVFCCGVAALCAWPRPSPAAPASSMNETERGQSLARIEIAMVGEVARDPLLFERIRSLFPAETAALRRDDQQLDQRAVLLPQRSDTVYIWITVSDGGQARVYLALAETGGKPRYLLREVRLDSGLDEVGGETLAEVAHSSAQALWSREQQSSRQTVVEALEREAEAPAPTEPLPTLPPGSSVRGASVASPTADDSPASTQAIASGPRNRTLRLGFGASGTTHSAGAEGWLQEVGGFFTFEYRSRLSFRAALRYLIPTHFDLAPTRVQLNGASGELRAGWLSSDATHMRFRIEAGLGVLLAHARAGIVDAQPKAHALAAQDFERTYALAAAGFEWPIGPAWLAVGADLRVPLRTTSYEVAGAGESGASTTNPLCPGGSLEIGIGFDPLLR